MGVACLLASSSPVDENVTGDRIRRLTEFSKIVSPIFPLSTWLASRSEGLDGVTPESPCWLLPGNSCFSRWWRKDCFLPVSPVVWKGGRSVLITRLIILWGVPRCPLHLSMVFGACVPPRNLWNHICHFSGTLGDLASCPCDNDLIWLVQLYSAFFTERMAI